MRSLAGRSSWTALGAIILSLGTGASCRNLRGDFYDPISGRRTCVTAPSAVDWAASTRLRLPDDRARLEAFLAERPSSVNAPYGAACETLLHAAARNGREDLIPVLIALRADLQVHDQRGETPLQVAATYGRAGVVTQLLAAGASPNASGPRERPPLNYAVAGLVGSSDDQMDTQLAVTRLLLAAGADINAREPGSNRTVLLSAIGSGPGITNTEPMVRFLVDHGADVRAHDAQGSAALVYAAGTGNPDIVALLLERGADRDASGAKDDSALGDALTSSAYGGYVGIAGQLIDHGADVNWRYRGPQPIEWRALPLAMALLIARSRDEATMARRREVALALLAHGADANARDGSRQTLLHAAAADGDVAALEILLAHGADVTARDGAGYTPLHRAVQKGHVDAAARLIASGADANAIASDGTTALALAAGDGSMETLIRRHAKD